MSTSEQVRQCQNDPPFIFANERIAGKVYKKAYKRPNICLCPTRVQLARASQMLICQNTVVFACGSRRPLTRNRKVMAHSSCMACHREEGADYREARLCRQQASLWLCPNRPNQSLQSTSERRTQKTT